jgi:uncharacterized protein (TIGR03067 family)
LTPLVAAAALALGFAPAPPPRADSAADLKVMQGAWGLVGYTDAGAPSAPPDPGCDLGLIVIRGARVHQVAGAKVTSEFALTLEAARSTRWYTAQGVAGTARGWVYRCIYRLEGDALTLCYNGVGLARPEAFEGPGRGNVVEVYKRRKP